MTIQYCSDLHLEFSANRQWLADHPLAVAGDILIVAGDTCQWRPEAVAADPFFDELAAAYRRVYLLPGNHEYYWGPDAAHAAEPMMETVRPNVWLVNNCLIELREVELVFSTLWSHLERHAGYVATHLSDFRCIRYEGVPLTVAQYNHLHHRCRTFLEETLAREPSRPRIVVTHHLPSPRCNAPEFQGSPLNEGFCTDLTGLVEQSRADYWIYGHSHRNVPPFELAGVRLLSNQLGYVARGEQATFQPAAGIQIPE